MTTTFRFAAVGCCAAMALACTSLPETPTGNVGERDGGRTGGEDANVDRGGMDVATGTGGDGPASGRDTALDLSSDIDDAMAGTGMDGPAAKGIDVALDLSADAGVVDSPQSPPDQPFALDLQGSSDAATGRENDGAVLGRDALVEVGADASSIVDSPQSPPCIPETDTQMCARLGRVCGSGAATDNCGNTTTPNCGPSSRLCSQDGLLGTCGGGNETCNVQGHWGNCSVLPAASGLDTCAPGNDDNCNGIANQGCLCIEGATRTCGPCNDGAQACTNGKAGIYGACTGGTQQAVYYFDGDGDGFGGTTTILACGAAPAGFVAVGGDCCDTDRNANPGVPATFWSSSRTACNNFDWDCDGKETQEFAAVASGCSLSGSITCSDGGWSTAVQGCGITGDWSSCEQISSTVGTVLHISCVPLATTQTQKCR